jgi:hypothetical protein
MCLPQHRRQLWRLEVNDYRTAPVIDHRTALLWILAGLVAGIVGFRDLNVTYLLIPLWTLTGYEMLQRGADLRTKEWSSSLSIWASPCWFC